MYAKKYKKLNFLYSYIKVYHFYPCKQNLQNENVENCPYFNQSYRGIYLSIIVYVSGEQDRWIRIATDLDRYGQIERQTALERDRVGVMS